MRVLCDVAIENDEEMRVLECEISELMRQNSVEVDLRSTSQLL